MRKLNLGCGEYPQEGYQNIDSNPRWADRARIRDVRKGLPYDDDSVDEILASHFLEHLSCEEMMDLLEEGYRVLKIGCEVKIVVPLMEFYTLDHKQYLSENCFDILGRDNGRDAARYFNKHFQWNIPYKYVTKGVYYDMLNVNLIKVAYEPY